MMQQQQFYWCLHALGMLLLYKCIVSRLVFVGLFISM